MVAPRRRERIRRQRATLGLPLVRSSQALLLGFESQPPPHVGHLFEDCPVLFVLCPPGKTAALLGEFSVVRWGFHAGTTPGPDGPFRNKLSETYGTFLKGRVPATKFCNAMLELLRIDNAGVPEYRGLPG